jgi:tRNA (guanosine-2'-O-)-methyltransferase
MPTVWHFRGSGRSRAAPAVRNLTVMSRQSSRQPPPSQGSSESAALLEYLTDYLTEARRRRLNDVLDQRTRQITVVLDDLRLEHNMSAVLRTCDAFGVQDLHVIETVEPFAPTPKISMGSDRWLSIARYQDRPGRLQCLEDLRERGYRIVGTGPPGAGTQAFNQIELDRPIALVFGNEKDGMSPEVSAACESRLVIPMVGFVESLNISVAAAIILQDLTTRLRASSAHWQMPAEDRFDLLLDWTRKSIPSITAIEQRWLEERGRAASSAAS